MSWCACKQINKTKSSPTFHLYSYIIFSLTVIFCVTTPSICWHVTFNILLMCHAFTFFFAFFSNTAAYKVKMSPCPSDLQIVFFFFSSVSATLSKSVNLSFSLSLSYFWLPHTSHTFASLVSRTLATRTVMSSMRSWILQLWLPLPAHEALLTLALGILSSMQPSSLAHTSACQYRPFPSDFGLKVHRLMHSVPSSFPFHIQTSLFMFHMDPFPVFLFSLGHFYFFALAALSKVGFIGWDIFRLWFLETIAIVAETCVSSAQQQRNELYHF